jgi:phosphoinositide-3-kinase regulatory subunit 4
MMSDYFKDYPLPLPLIPHQDMFSLGCTIAELFLDGRAACDLGQLLEYKRREWDPATQVGA